MGLNNLTCVGKQWQISHLRGISLLQAAWILFYISIFLCVSNKEV